MDDFSRLSRVTGLSSATRLKEIIKELRNVTLKAWKDTVTVISSDQQLAIAPDLFDPLLESIQRCSHIDYADGLSKSLGSSVILVYIMMVIASQSANRTDDYLKDFLEKSIDHMKYCQHVIHVGSDDTHDHWKLNTFIDVLIVSIRHAQHISNQFLLNLVITIRKSYFVYQNIKKVCMI